MVVWRGDRLYTVAIAPMIFKPLRQLDQLATGLIVALWWSALCVVAVVHRDRPIWYDESWVVDFAMQPTLGDTLRTTLEQQQPAAVGYMALMHLIEPWAVQPWRYRLASILAGAVVLLLAGRLAADWVGRNRSMGFAAAGLLLVSPLLQRYTIEIKQYMIEVALTLSLIIAASSWIQTKNQRVAMLWVLLSMAAMLLTFAGWFAVAGTGLLLLFYLAWQRRQREWIALLASIGFIGSLGLIVYLTYTRHLANADHLHDYWQTEYLPRDLTLLSTAYRMGNQLLAEAWYTYPSLALMKDAWLPVAIVGWGLWFKRERTSALAAAMVVVMTLIANLLGKWPLGMRVNLPMVVIGLLCQLALPLGLWGLWRDRVEQRVKKSTIGSDAGLPGSDASMESTKTLSVPWHDIRRQSMAVMIALIGTVLVSLETRQHDFRVADIHGLLKAIGQQVGPDDLLLYDSIIEVNRRMQGRTFVNALLAEGWPRVIQVTPELHEAVTRTHSQSGGQVYVASGHLNPPMLEKHLLIAPQLAEQASLTLVWQGQLVGLMRLERTLPDRLP